MSKPERDGILVGPPPHTQRVLRWTGLLLHIGLVVILALFLIFAAKGHMEHAIQVSLNEFETVSNALSISLLIFITLYTVPLVLVTQQVALHRAVNTFQTLTATHDITSSWAGLGAALVTCWRQIALPASVTGTGTIATYLLCIAILHIIFPTTIKLQLAQQSTSANATMGYPALTLLGTEESPFPYNWYSPNALLPLLSDLNPSQTPGLYNATLYTVLDNWEGIGNLTVPAISFNVSCGYFPNGQTGGVINDFLEQVDDDPSPSPVNYTIIEANYAVQDTRYNFSYLAHPLDNRQINSFPLIPRSDDESTGITYPLGRSTAFYASFTVTDSEGGQGSLLTLPYTIEPTKDQERTRDLQAFGCSVTVYNHTVGIDAATRLPNTDVAKKTSSKWEPWAPLLSTGNGENRVQDVFLDGWWQIWYAAQYMPTLNPAGWSCWHYAGDTGDVPYCGQIDVTTLVTQYIEDRLELRERNLTSVTLHELENTMGSMTAAVYWGAQHGRNRQASEQTMFIRGVRGTVDATRSEAIGRVNIDLVYIILSLITALVLLILSYLMAFRQSVQHPTNDLSTGISTTKRSPIDTVGVLQMLWLAQGVVSPEIIQPVSQVDDPSTVNLRRAGMVMIQLDGQRRRFSDDSEISLLSLHQLQARHY